MRIKVNDTHEARFLEVSGELMEPDRFEERMIASMVHQGIIRPLSESMLSGNTRKYDITGLRTLSEAFAGRTLSAEDIAGLIIRIDTIMKDLRNHMLPDSCILLDPSYIYAEENGNIRFIAVSGMEEGFQPNMRKLGDFIFLHADTKDERALGLSSALLRIMMQEGFRMHDLVSAAEKFRKKEPETGTAVEICEEKTEKKPEEEKVREIGRLPVFEEKERRNESPQEAFIRIVSEKTAQRVNAARGKTAKKCLIILAVIVAGADAVYFLGGKEVFLRSLPVFLLAAAGLTLYFLYMVFLKKRT